MAGTKQHIRIMFGILGQGSASFGSFNRLSGKLATGSLSTIGRGHRSTGRVSASIHSSAPGSCTARELLI